MRRKVPVPWTGTFFGKKAAEYKVFLVPASNVRADAEHPFD
jgi:hypothetical protein